tara:strand:+ start:977 stop:1333 length:357 start_codon:yes stop_codon:yes gene_type:complete
MGYEIINNIDKGYFDLVKANRGNSPKYPIDYYLDKFNIDLNDYWIMKKSNTFRFIDIKDMEKWSGVICFRKDTFNKEHIDKWIKLIYDKLDLNGVMKYLNKPFPPIEIFNKIKIVGKE